MSSWISFFGNNIQFFLNLPIDSNSKMAPFRLNGPPIGFSLALLCHSGSEMNRRQICTGTWREIPLRVENSNYYVLPLWLRSGLACLSVLVRPSMTRHTHTFLAMGAFEWENRSHLTFRLVCLPKEKRIQWNLLVSDGMHRLSIFCHQCILSFCDDSIENISSFWEYFHCLESCATKFLSVGLQKGNFSSVAHFDWFSIDCGNCRKELSQMFHGHLCLCLFVCAKLEVQSAASFIIADSIRFLKSQPERYPLDSEGDAETHPLSGNDHFSPFL